MSSAEWEWKGGAVRYRTTAIRRDDENVARVAEFERVEQLLNSFLGDAASQYQLDAVEYIDNTYLERNFERKFREFVMRQQALSWHGHGASEGDEEVEEGIEGFEQVGSEREKRRWVMRVLESYRVRMFGAEDVNLVLAWHGAGDAALNGICETGVKIPDPLPEDHILVDDMGARRASDHDAGGGGSEWRRSSEMTCECYG